MFPHGALSHHTLGAYGTEFLLYLEHEHVVQLLALRCREIKLWLGDAFYTPTRAGVGAAVGQGNASPKPVSDEGGPGSTMGNSSDFIGVAPPTVVLANDVKPSPEKPPSSRSYISSPSELS